MHYAYGYRYIYIYDFVPCRLFVTPHFDGIFPDFTLTLRRRRNDKEIKLTGFDTFRYVGEDSYEEGIYNTKPNVVPMVYACATMWHETRQEMTQLLKSLFRYLTDRYSNFLLNFKCLIMLKVTFHNCITGSRRYDL